MRAGRGRLVFESAETGAQPRVELDYLAHPDDLARMIEGVRLAWRVANSKEMAPFIERLALLTEEVIRSREEMANYVRTVVQTMYHPVATCPMGPDGDEDSVVDQYGRVRGVDGLRVADASIMPSIPRANTNLTCIMIGEKVADWLTAE